jgi:hypothetical protein
MCASGGAYATGWRIYLWRTIFWTLGGAAKRAMFGGGFEIFGG